jgi:predicted nucleotide-binding protein
MDHTDWRAIGIERKSMFNQNTKDDINYFITECNKLIDELKTFRTSMFVNMPPYSLFSADLGEFISNNPSLPKTEADEIKLNLSLKHYSVNRISIENIKKCLESILRKLPTQQLATHSSNSQFMQSESINSSNVFIVHGHDDYMKVSVSNFVRKVGLNPVILHERPDGGRTIIEKFQDNSDVAYAIVLYSPDDEMKSGKMRARQNVMLEHGFFISKLGRNRVVGLVREADNIEYPSDLQGILYKPFDANWELAVAKEMQHSGLDIDLNKI